MTHKHNDIIKINNHTIHIYTTSGYCEQHGYIEGSDDYQMVLDSNEYFNEPSVNFNNLGVMLTDRTEPVVHYDRYSVGDIISIDNVDYIIEPKSNNNFIPTKK